MKEIGVVLLLLAVVLLAAPVGFMLSAIDSLKDAATFVVEDPVSQVISLTPSNPAGPAPIQIVAQGAVTDLQRFQLALNAGWNFTDAIIATAISIAEDGSGNPTIMSPPNIMRDGSKTYDFCLWQINSSWWAQFGGQQALADPQTCANAAHVIWSHGGWNQWCTYPGGCGGGPGSPVWPQALARAKAIAVSQ